MEVSMVICSGLMILGLFFVFISLPFSNVAFYKRSQRLGIFRSLFIVNGHRTAGGQLTYNMLATNFYQQQYNICCDRQSAVNASVKEAEKLL